MVGEPGGDSRGSLYCESGNGEEGGEPKSPSEKSD